MAWRWILYIFMGLCGGDASQGWSNVHFIDWFPVNYHKTSSISRTKSHNLNVSNLVLQLSLFNPLKPGVKSRMKM